MELRAAKFKNMVWKVGILLSIHIILYINSIVNKSGIEGFNVFWNKIRPCLNPEKIYDFQNEPKGLWFKRKSFKDGLQEKGSLALMYPGAGPQAGNILDCFLEHEIGFESGARLGI